MRRLIALALLISGLSSPTMAQSPQLGAGQVLGNSTAAQRPARGESISAILDRAISSTRGAILERGASGWAATTPGTSGLSYVSNGAGADPAYQVLGASGGGTGQSLYAVGDILFASTTTALSRLAGVATGNALISGGVNTAPSWGKITSSHLNITTTSCTNQSVSAISAGGVGTCSTVGSFSITDDTATNALMFPVWVTANTGNLPPKVSSTRLFFNPAGPRLTITKNTATATPVNTNTILHLISDDSGAENSIEVTTVKSDSVLMLSRANGTMAARTPLGVDEYVGTVVSSGIDANNGALQQGNAMSFKSTEVWNTGQHGMRTVFYGTLDGTLTYAEWASLRNARLGLNDSNPQYKLTVSKHATAGITDPFGNDGIGMIGADAAGITLSMQTFGTSPNPNITMFKARGTNAAKVAVNSGDVIGQLQAFGYAGSTSQYNGGAGFEIAAGENFGTGAAGTILRLTATPNGSTSQVAAATVYGSRGMFVGTGAADPGAGIIGAAVGVQTTATTVGSLGTCNAAAKGLRKFVTDSNAASYTAGIGAIVASGGTTNVPVICDGTNYRIGANDNLPLSNKAA